MRDGFEEQFGIGALEAEAEVAFQDAILEEIVTERAYQDKRWGTASDDKNTVNDWVAITTVYMALATPIGASKEQQRTGLLKAAAVLVAAVESFDRNGGFPPRHYDKK